MKTVGIECDEPESPLRRCRAGAEAIWELLRQIEEDPTWEILRRLEVK